uniref:Putative secreted protein n=1 Tax=Ixodes ricinus TaxID=34613 RepID=A0A6B0UYJ7_IXORI
MQPRQSVPLARILVAAVAAAAAVVTPVTRRRTARRRVVPAARRAPTTMEDGAEVNELVHGEQAAQLFRHPGLDFLSIPSDLDLLPFVPRIVQVSGLGERQLPPADPVHVEDPSQSPGTQTRGQHPLDRRAVVGGLGCQTGKTLELSTLFDGVHQDDILTLSEGLIQLCLVLWWG